MIHQATRQVYPGSAPRTYGWELEDTWVLWPKVHHQNHWLRHIWDTPEFALSQQQGPDFWLWLPGTETKHKSCNGFLQETTTRFMIFAQKDVAVLALCSQPWETQILSQDILQYIWIILAFKIFHGNSVALSFGFQGIPGTAPWRCLVNSWSGCRCLLQMVKRSASQRHPAPCWQPSVERQCMGKWTRP